MLDGIHFLQDGVIVPSEGLQYDRRPELVPRHLLITGVGRSGTTACASIVAKFGMVTERPTAYFENMALRKFINARDAAGALKHLRKWPAAGQRFFWKDPKIWIAKFDPFIDELPPEIGLMFVFRDPLSIAARDAALDGGDLLTQLVHASATANIYVKRISRIRNRNVALVSYEKLLVNPEAVVGALARFLQISDAAAIRAAVEIIEPSPASYERHFAPRRAVAES